MPKKFHWPSWYSPNPRGKFFFSSKFFNQSDFEKKWNSFIRLFSHWNREMSEQWCWKNSIDLRRILQIRENKLFFRKFFQPIRFREKMKFIYSIIFSLESRDEWTVMLKKFYWPLLNSPNPREKFFFIKFFQLIRIREKIKFNSSIFLSLESRDQWTVMLKKFYWPLLYSPNPRKKFFFLKFFWTNQNSRKNQIQFFYFFVIEIERLANTDAEKIPLAFVVFSKSAWKNFFFWKFFNQWNFEKKLNSILRFFPLWNREISEQWCWKNSIDLCCIFRILEKNFFFWNFFNQSEFEKKSNCILRFFCHWNREMSEQWCWKNSTKLCCILQIREKNFFFLKFFQTIGIRV